MDDEARSLAFSPEFQRLRYVRLCNIHSLYLTGASEPKRFEHCIGVYHLADLWTGSRELSSKHRQIVRSAALLHDLMTGPFGHSFQYVMEDNLFEQRFEHTNLAGGVHNRFLQIAAAAANFAGRPFTVNALLGDIAAEVFAAIDGKGPFGPLISGTLDLDNLDNVVRLAFHMGLCDDADKLVPRCLAPLLESVDGGLGAREGAEPLIQRWFEIRRRLYEFLLLDRGEFAAKAMLTLAVEQAADARLLGPDDWRLTDEGLLDELEKRSVGENQAIGQSVKRLRVGDLFDCIGVWRSSATPEYLRLSDSAAKRAAETEINAEIASGGGPRLKICIHYILDQKKTCRALSFRDMKSGGEKTVGYNSEALLVGAFVTNARSTALSSNERLRAGQAVRSILGRIGVGELSPTEEPLGETADEFRLFAE